MKKSLISLAVAAALVPAAAMADTSNVTVYGKIHVSYDRLDNDAETGGFVSNNSSRLGFKGSEDLGDGLKAIWQYESNVNLDGGGNGLFGSARDTFVGVSGNFGALTAGRQSWNDLFKHDANFFADGIGGPAAWIELRGSSRANNTIKYATPNMSGFNASLTYVTPGGFGADNAAATAAVNAAAATAACTPTSAGENCQMATGNTTESSYALRAAYNNGPLFAAATYLDQAANSATRPDMKTTSLAASYTFGPGKVAAQWVKVKDANMNTGDDDVRYWTIGGNYKVTANGTVKVNYTDANKGGATTTSSNAGADMIAVGYEHSLSKRTIAYATYARANNDAAGVYTMTGSGHGAATGAIVAGRDASGISLGMVHDF